MKLEYKDLLRIGTWELVDCPHGYHPIGCK